MILARRKFLIGMAGLIAAPAIVRIENLMPIRSLVDMRKIYNYIPGEIVNIDVLYGKMNITKEIIKIFENINLFLQNV